jgi:hypothetical protein
MPDISKYWCREHFYDLPSIPTVDALAQAVSPTTAAVFAEYQRHSLNRWSMTDEVYLNQHPDKHASITFAQQLYGYRNYHELVCHVWVLFPHLEFKFSTKEESLTDWEQCCAARMMLKTGKNQQEMEKVVGKSSRFSHYMKTWTRRWLEAEACLLCRHITEDLLEQHQINGFSTRYCKKIACLVDGTTVDLGTPRKNSILQRSTFSNKAGRNAAQGLGWVSPAGLLLLYSSLFNGRLSEKDTVWLHRELLRVFPRGWGQLVDRGFSSCTAAYENLLQCFFPAFAKDLCRSTILDAKLQSSDRYVVETFFSRVKEFLLLSTTVPVERAWQLESAWVCALSATDLYAPLRPPVSWEATQQAMRDAKSPLVEALRVEAAGRPLPWMFREFA